MSKFIFYCGPDLAFCDAIRMSARVNLGAIKEIRSGQFFLVAEEGGGSEETGRSERVTGAVAGYVCQDGSSSSRNHSNFLETSSTLNFLEHVASETCWPLGNGWTGTFAAVSFDLANQRLILCNDVLGYFPLYYCHARGGIVGSTKLVLIGRALRPEPDPVGVLERITPGLCNYGRRTLLQGVSRLLPGEWRRFRLPHLEEEVLFDNSLYSGLHEPDIDTAARQVWDSLQREVSLACRGSKSVNVAMSGGWDSRHMLAAVADQGRSTTCYTYGNRGLYETQLALRCANVVGAGFQCFGIEGKYFPPHEVMRTLVRDTESAQILSLWALLEGVGYGTKRSEVILLGDMCAAINGQYITKLSSRAARKRIYLLNLIGREAPFLPSTSAAYAEWKTNKRAELLEAVLSQRPNLAPCLCNPGDVRAISEQIIADLELSFSRIQSNLPPFTVMFDELFGWFHRARYPMASQCLLSDSTFRARCPALAFRFLRLISNIHPRLRNQRRLLTAIARLPQFDRLGRIPSAQIPWLGARSPRPLRLAVWGARSATDQWLIRRALGKRSNTARQRVLPSLDYIAEYQRPGVLDTVRSWFSGDWISADKYVEIAKSRAEFRSWPLTNVDIAVPANISNTLDLCCP